MGSTVGLTRDGAILYISTRGSTESVRIRFRGASGTRASGETATGGFANYYRSQDPKQWLSHIPLYSRVRYRSFLNGIDAVFHGNEGWLEYDLEVSPRATPADIRFSLEGADKFWIESDGALAFTAGTATWRLLPPVAYQTRAGTRQGVRSAYQVLSDGTVGFTIGSYDHSLPLTIDPVVQYSNIIGLNNSVHVAGIQVDSGGNLYIAGDTFASNYPVVNGNPPKANSSEEIFISKLDPTGTTILYSTYIPASSFSTAHNLALDSSGNAYIAGITSAPDFPLTSTTLGSCSQFCNAGFVAKFASDGTLAYATLLSSGQALPKGLAVDSAGSAYVAGLAADNTLQTVNAFQPSYVGQICTSCTDAFFAKLNPTGNGYIFASYFANPKHTSGENIANGIGIDGSGNVYLAGQGDTPYVNPWQIGGALFIAKFASDGKTLLFSSGFGGNSGTITGMAVGSDGTLFLAGQAGSDFPFALNAFSHMDQDKGNGLFAAAVNPALTGFSYSTYLGDGNVNAVFLNAGNNHLFLGGLSVRNLPGLMNAVVTDLSKPGFAMELDASGNPVNVTQFGGHLTQEIPTAIAADGSGNLYLAGSVSPANGSPQPDPIVVGSNLGKVTGSNFGVFFAKIGPTNAPQISLNTQPPFLILRNAGSVDLHITSVALGGSLAQQFGNCTNTVPAGTSCVLTVADALGNLAAGTVTITSDANPSTQTFSINLPPGTPSVPIGDLLWFSDTPTIFPPQLTGTSTDSRTFRISNVGTAAGALDGFFANGGVSQSNDCPASLAPRTSCTIQATVMAGAGQPSLRISHDGGILQDFELLVPVATSPFLLSVTGINFGIQEIQGVAIPRVVTVTNTSDAAATPPALSLTGDPEFALSGNTCVAALPPHQSCVIGVQFNPKIDGSRSATLSIGDGQVQLFAQGDFNSVVQASPLQLNFFPVIVHRAPVTLPLTLSNSSASPVGIASFVFSLPDYSETDNCAGQVPANSSCTVQVGFSAQALGPRDATMTISFTGGIAAQILTLAGGVGVTPMDVTPAVLNFGSALTGTTTASQGVVLGNGRQGTSQGYTLSVTGDFTITQNPCSNPMPGFFGCTIQLAFAPKNPGTQQGALTVSYPGISEQSIVTLNGTGVTTGAILNAPATFNLGSTNVGTPLQQPLPISNTGNADLTISSFSISGPNAADFSVAPGQCSTVPAGNSCSIQVQFSPGSPLQKQATLTIADNALNNPHTVGLMGTGLGPSITLPGPTFIGQVLIGQFTKQQVLIGNAGNADLVISSLTITGTNAADFSADIGSCGVIHGPSTCLISVAFTPSAPGTRVANVIVTDNQVGSPQSFQVSGNGLGPDYAVPSTIDFGNQLRGTGSPQQTLTISNTGNMQLEVSSVTVTGDFSAVNACFGVNPGGSCTIKLTFSPTAAGSRGGTLTIFDNTNAGSRRVRLTGNGLDFQLAGSGSGTPTATIPSGQTATYNLTLAGTGGFTGSVALACSGAPQSATCTVNSTSIQITNSTPVPFTVTVPTQTSVAAVNPPQRLFEALGLVACAPLICILPAFSRTRRSRAQRLLAIGLLAISLGFAGCGGGGGGASPKLQTTPPGAYSLTVTATSSGVNRQINLSLVVQ